MCVCVCDHVSLGFQGVDLEEGVLEFCWTVRLAVLCPAFSVKPFNSIIIRARMFILKL